MNERPEATRGLELAPYQQQFVESVLKEGDSTRFVILSPPGYGKSTAIVELVNRLVGEHPAARILIVSPVMTLSQQWEDVLNLRSVEHYVVDPQGYRRLELVSGPDESPWSKPGCYLTTLGFLAAQERVSEISQHPWDLVVLDEVHMADAFQEALRRIWTDQKVRRVVAATATEPAWLGELPGNAEIVRWTRDTIALGFFGRMPERRVERHLVNVTLAEEDFANSVVGLVTARMREEPKAQLSGMAVLRRLASSMFAAEQTLRRMAASAPNAWISADADELVAMDSDSPGEDQAQLLERPQLMDLLDRFDEIERDSKLLYCERLLAEAMPTRTERQVVLFSDFADTAHYLNSTLQDRGWETVMLTGSISTDERTRALQKAISTPGAIIIATSAAVEGLSLAFTDRAIHYDVPWSPLQLVQRFGRIERISNAHTIVVHYLLIDAVTESTAWADHLLRLTGKVERLLEADPEEWWEWWVSRFASSNERSDPSP